MFAGQTEVAVTMKGGSHRSYLINAGYNLICKLYPDRHRLQGGRAMETWSQLIVSAKADFYQSKHERLGFRSQIC